MTVKPPARGRKCGACGEVGHMRNNPACPARGKQPVEAKSPQKQSRKELAELLTSAAIAQDPSVEVPKPLGRMWEIIRKLVQAHAMTPTPVKGVRVRQLLPGGFSSPSPTPSEPGASSPQTPRSGFVSSLSSHPDLLKDLFLEAMDLIKLDTAVGHSSADVDLLRRRCGEQVAKTAEDLMGALSPFTGVLGKRAFGRPTELVRNNIAAVCSRNPSIVVDPLQVANDVAEHVLRAIHPKFLFFERLSQIDMRSEHQLYTSVAMLLYSILGYNCGQGLHLDTLSNSMEEEGSPHKASRSDTELADMKSFLLDHELWVKGSASRGPIEFVVIRRRPGPVRFQLAAEVKVREDQLPAAIPQVFAEGIALIETNRSNAAYGPDELHSVVVLLNTLRVWFKFRFTIQDATSGSMQVQVGVTGPLEYYDSSEGVLFDEAEDVIKLLIEGALVDMIRSPLDDWIRNEELFSEWLEKTAEEQFGEREVRDGSRGRARIAELEKALAEKDAIIQRKDEKIKSLKKKRQSKR